MFFFFFPRFAVTAKQIEEYFFKRRLNLSVLRISLFNTASFVEIRLEFSFDLYNNMYMYEKINYKRQLVSSDNEKTAVYIDQVSDIPLLLIFVLFFIK